MAEIVAAQDLINRYPDTTPSLANAQMPYATFGSEAFATLALQKQSGVAARLQSCGLREAIWSELGAAYQDFISAQAHWGTARTFGVADATIKNKVERLEFLRDEMLAQADFYLVDPDDQKRIDEIREGDDLPDMISDGRQLVLLIRPKRQLILDPEFKTEWLDEALTVADEVDTALASRTASDAVEPQGQQMRRIRDRTVARVHALVSEIRRFGKHAYRRDPKTAAAFASDYLRRKRRKAASSGTTPQQ